MNNKRFFFVVRYLPSRADSALLAGRCISQLHGYLLRNSHVQIGVSFPDWSDTQLGSYIGFVSTEKDHLAHFRQRAYFQIMQEDGLFSLTTTLEVPIGCAEVRFVRNQGLAKLFAGERRRRLARAKRRAEARGDVFLPQSPPEHRDVLQFHRVLMQSQSNNQDFVMHIEKEPYDNSDSNTGFNNYGLACRVQHRGSVPELASIVATLF
ncbi:type I-F CRISPR-associated endoribonuclease Cas6/Csy4 [Aeromonas hydrophila]|uniref:type I-F CRISPR-associated endoribonuclease Cas6/Csy4 n=1 Tax=Aeromonas hydrophila TaxID=644 RepID=UPI0030D1E8B8